MQQTLMIGDYFLANKWAWGFGKYSFPIALPFNGRIMGSEPKRGDIAVFRNEITNEDYIKRVIGLPGDRIQMKAGRLYINGTMVERELTGTAKDTDSYMTTVDVNVYTETEATAARLMPINTAADTGKKLLCPMPGLVVSIAVTEGQEVKAGEALAVVEAMKMQNVLRAERDGTVKKIHTAPGATLAVDALILEFA